MLPLSFHLQDMEAKVAQLEETARSRSFPDTLNLRTTATPSAASSSANTSSHVVNTQASGSQPIDVSDVNPTSSASSTSVNSGANSDVNSDVNPASSASSTGVNSGANSDVNSDVNPSITTTTEVRVDSERAPIDELVELASSSSAVQSRVPEVLVEHDNRITAAPNSSGGVVIDCSTTRVEKNTPSSSSNAFPSASIPPTGNGHEPATFEANNSARKPEVVNPTIAEMFGDSDDDIPMDAVAELTQRDKQRDHGDVEGESQRGEADDVQGGDATQSQEGEVSSQLSEDSAYRLINSGRNTPCKDENGSYYEDISDEENEDHDERRGGSEDEGEGSNGKRGGDSGDVDGGESGDEEQRGSGSEEGNVGEGRSGNDEEGDEDVEVGEGDEQMANEGNAAADMLAQAMQEFDLPSTSSDLPAAYQSFADDGNVQLSRGAASLRLAPKNGVVSDRYPLTTLVTAQAGFHDRDSAAFAAKIRQDAYTKENPLMKDTQVKKQSVITNHMSQPIARQAVNPTPRHESTPSAPDSTSRGHTASQRQQQPSSSNQQGVADPAPQREDKPRHTQQPSSSNQQNVADPAPRREDNPRHTQQPSSSNQQNVANPASHRQTVPPRQEPSSPSNETNSAKSSSKRPHNPSAPNRQQSSSSCKRMDAADSPSDANGPRGEPLNPSTQPHQPSTSQSTQRVSPSSSVNQASIKRKAPTAMPSGFRPPKRPNTSVGASRQSGDLPIVRKDGIANKSKTFNTNKCCQYCFCLFPRRGKNLTARQHVTIGACDFIKKNFLEVGVNKKCKNCPKEFTYHKGMYEDIICHFKDENHSCLCHICGESHLFSDIFSHISSEILNYFSEGVKCMKCKVQFKSVIPFYHHLESIHLVKDKNASVFSKFLLDSHPNFEYLLTALLLTHAKEKS